MYKNLILIAPLLLLALAAGCSRPDNSGLQIFRYNESAGLATLDPAFARDQSIIWPCRQLYNGLVELDSSLAVRPAIAHSWSVSDDGLHYRFHLRTDVRFHRNPLFATPDSTRTVTAADFAYSFSRIVDPAVASPGVWIFSCVDRFDAVDDSTFDIHLREPFAPFLGQLGMVYCSVVPREVVEHYGRDFRSHPCGTGPFRLQLWKEGVKLVLRRNPDYFERDSLGRRLPYLDAVATTFIVDRQTVFLEFVKGNLDFMNSLDASYKDEILTTTGQLKPKYASRIRMESTPYLNTEYLGFLLDDPQSPFADPRLRRAVNLGFDRVKMMKYLRNNVGQPGTGGFVPPSLLGSEGADTYGFGYAPDSARALLAAAGHPDGRGLPPLKLQTTAGYLDLCKYIQQQLGLLGLDVQVDVGAPAALREQVAQGKAQWFRGSWVADYPDAENYLALFFSPNRSPAGPNTTHYSNPRFDRLYLDARSDPDPARRAHVYRQMDSLLMADPPVIVLYYDRILHFTHPYVRGLRTNAMNTLDLRHVSLDRH